MNDKHIENYLKQSTRGLWGRKRSEVREELSTHIEGRVNAHLIAGLTEAEAIEKTLMELGKPREVNTGMAKIYTLPIMASSGLMVALCCLIIVAILQGSTAQTLKISNIFPTDNCLNAKEETLPYYCNVGGWTNIESLKEALEPQGVAFEPRDMGGWSVTFPGGTPTLIASPDFSGEWYFDGEAENDEITLHPNTDYVHIRNFIGALSTTGLPIRIEGWDKPTLSIGDTTLEIDLLTNENNTNYGGMSFYMEAINWGLATSGIPLFKPYQYWSTSATVNGEPKKFKVDDKQGEVYGIAVIVDASQDSSVEPEQKENSYVVYTEIGQVDEDGFVTLDVPKDQPLTFVRLTTSMTENGQAMLVRLSGDLGKSGLYVRIPPEQITLE